MSGNGATMDYDFGQKRHWRRWVWNRIAERTGSPREAICVYLPGATDLDRPLALERGFLSANLIGVERNDQALDQLRGSGVLTIDGDLFRAVEAVAYKRPVSVVFADLCCGLTVPTWSWLSMAMNLPNLQHATFIFNLLRGRDQQSGPIRELMSDEAFIGKHRGKMLLHWLLSTRAMKHAEVMVANGGWPDIDMERVDKGYAKMLSTSNAAFNSYRSTAGNQVFDTVVFKNPMTIVDYSQVQLDVHSLYKKHGRITEPAFVQAKRSAAAIMAHRTRRLQKQRKALP